MKLDIFWGQKRHKYKCKSTFFCVSENNILLYPLLWPPDSSSHIDLVVNISSKQEISFSCWNRCLIFRSNKPSDPPPCWGSIGFISVSCPVKAFFYLIWSNRIFFDFRFSRATTFLLFSLQVPFIPFVKNLKHMSAVFFADSFSSRRSIFPWRTEGRKRTYSKRKRKKIFFCILACLKDCQALVRPGETHSFVHSSFWTIE